MSRTSTNVNWDSAKDEFAKAEVNERGFEFLKALCTGAEFSQVEDKDKELATRIVRLSKALKHAEDKAVDIDELYPRFDRPATRQEQSEMITNDLKTFERIMRNVDLEEFSKALEVFSNALCDVDHKLNPIAERIASGVDGVVPTIEGSVSDW